jgi:hypothetical protein
MSENRYAPPATQVEDVVVGIPLPQRPRSVSHGAWMLWASIVIAMPEFLYDMFNPPPEATPGAAWVFYTVIMLFLLALIAFGAWTIWMAWKGRNWARIVQLGFLILGLAMAPWIIPTEFQESTFSGMHIIATMLLNIAGLIFWYTPTANAWYRLVKEARG